jgi:hypothetical protein
MMTWQAVALGLAGNLDGDLVRPERAPGDAGGEHVSRLRDDEIGLVVAIEVCSDQATRGAVAASDRQINF